MRNYEIVTLVSPQIPDDAVSQTVEKVSRMILNRGGTVERVQRWGRRRLAYPIGRYREAHYFLTQFTLEPNLTAELDAELRVSEEVLKHLIVKVEAPGFEAPQATVKAAVAEYAVAAVAGTEEKSPPETEQRDEELKGDS